jgi:hypothetical protein
MIDMFHPAARQITTATTDSADLAKGEVCLFVRSGVAMAMWGKAQWIELKLR